MYVPGLILLACAFTVFMVAEMGPPGGKTFWLFCSAALALIGCFQVFRAWWRRWNTEIAVTNRRVIYKTGFISRDTNEMHMDKVESVKVDQSVLGRILGYGDVTVLGTGTGFEPLKNVDSPIELRNHITGS
jgi:uncharacterized membrane protein YdbT with pleckstrin-like domain